MRSRSKIALSTGCALVLLGLTGVFVFQGGPSIVAYWITHPQKDGFSFDFERCDDSRATQDNTIRPEWDASGTLHVSTVAEANCSTSWMFGDYSIRSNTVFLEYQAIVPVGALCDCPHKVTYRIAGLPRTGYEVQLLARPNIYTIWTLLWFLVGTAVILVAAAFAAIWLRAGRLARVAGSSEFAKEARGRRAIWLLSVLLAVSVGANIVFSFLAGSTYMSALVNEHISDSIVVYLGQRAGREQANRDFAEGTIRRYQFNDVKSVPHDGPARAVATMDVGGPPLLHRYREKFVEHYNLTMDKLASPDSRPKGKRR